MLELLLPSCRTCTSYRTESTAWVQQGWVKRLGRDTEVPAIMLPLAMLCTGGSGSGNSGSGMLSIGDACTDDALLVREY